ncbi:MAG: chloramphenicol resistance protein, partial [Lentisphaeria bacterium]
MSTPKSILEGLRDYLYTCPLLANGRIRIEYLGAKPSGYSLESTPANPVYKQYASGDYLGQLLFVLASREEYGAEDRLAIESSGFYEQLSGWVAEQNSSGIFPDLPAGKYAQRVELTTQGYAYTNDIKTARYQIQGRLIYYVR